MFMRRFPTSSIAHNALRSQQLAAITQLNRTSRRNMTTFSPPPPPGKFEWLVIIPDRPGSFDKRMEVRPKHFAGLDEVVESGFMKVGGAILEEVPKEGEGLKMNGSAAVCIAASKEELLEELKKDIYATSGVWDFDNIQIYPYKCAIRLP